MIISATGAPVMPTAESISAAWLPSIFSRYVAMNCRGATAGGSTPVMEGTRVAWHPLTVRFQGPAAAENDSPTATGLPNPFLDYRLQVAFLSPSGRLYDVPGFFAGDGAGGAAGDVWLARFSPDEPGTWRFCVSFRAGPNVAVDLDPQAGEPLVFDGVGGAFEVTPVDRAAPGFLRWGRLEYVGGHYLKFRDGPYWLKGGTNSPENFLAYTGFVNTVDQGGNVPGFLHSYAPHVGDWRPGDPTLPGAPDEGKGIIGALNYLSEQGVNSFYFLPMNLGGDGGDTYPFLAPDDPTHYDLGKLEQWTTIFEHAQRRGVALHIVLNETEPANRLWLDDGQLGVERKLFYRELAARVSYLLAVKWNLSEEVVFTRDQVLAFSGYLRALDWAAHPIAIHNPANWYYPYEEVLGQPTLEATALQYEADRAGELVELFRLGTEQTGRPWVVEADENNPAGIGLTPDNAGQLRKSILYDVYFSGGAGVEWYLGYHDLPLGGDLNLENFRTREAMWAYMRYARTFLERYTPFWEMTPADELLAGEAADYGGGEVLALPGKLYAIYLPSAAATGALSVPHDGDYHLFWYDPRRGRFVGRPARVSAADGLLLLGSPPDTPATDWVVLARAAGAALETNPPAGYP